MGGSGGGHKSGGGGSGKQSWPKYMHRSHWAMMIGAYDEKEPGIWSTRLSDYDTEPEYKSVLRDIAESHDNSPFEGYYAYDPKLRLSSMQTEWSAFDVFTETRDDDTDINRIITNVKTKVDSLVDETTIQGVVDNYDSTQSKAHMNSIARFSAGMADIGGHNSSAYIIGLALMEDEHLRAVRKVDKDLRFEAYKDKLRLYDSFTKDEINLFNTQHELRKASVGMRMELERMSIIAEKEQSDRDVELSIRDNQWEMEVWQYGSNVLAAISGAVGSPTHAIGKEAEGGSRLQNVLGGVLSGAAGGMISGGPWAAGVGGLIGGVSGLTGD